MFQKKQCVSATIELTSEDLLFILSCIETSDRQQLKELANEKLYTRLVQKYVNLVMDRIEPTATPNEIQQLVN